MDLIKQLGYLSLGTRFRILTDKLLQDVDKVYKNLDVDFEPRWFTVFYLVHNKGSISVTEIANHLGYTQPAITQILNILIDKGLIKSVKEKEDSRKKVITVTPKGKELFKKLEPVWQIIERSVRELFLSTGYDILSVIGKIEAEIEKKDIYSRVSEAIKEKQQDGLKIVNYQPEYKNDFRDLNYHWIKKYFKIEEPDRKVLENPEQEILAKGGYIFFADYNDDIVGTAALIKHLDGTYELAKMAVKEEVQGRQIGIKLAQKIIEKAVEENADELFLESNTSLIAATNLYRKLGFEEIEQKEPSKYERSTIRMNLKLNATVPAGNASNQ